MPSDLHKVPNRKPVKVSADFDRPNREHLEILHSGVDVWNKWRKQNPNIIPHLAYLRFRNVDFSGFNFDHALLPFSILSRCVFEGASFRGADLRGASLRRADLTKANLNEAILRHVSLAECKVQDAIFSNCHIYGISAWNLIGEPKDQSNMVMKAEIEEAGITVNDLELAQFLFLLLNHENLRKVLNSVTEKGVLILGRFAGGGIDVLRSIAKKLTDMKYLPIIFDFERPQDRNYTETIKTLVGLSRFVIVDLSGPSVPQELYATVPHFKIPFVPILEQGKRPYAMFADILEYDWVLKPIVEFDSTDTLINLLPTKIVTPAEKKHEKRQKLLRELFAE